MSSTVFIASEDGLKQEIAISSDLSVSQICDILKQKFGKVEDAVSLKLTNPMGVIIPIGPHIPKNSSDAPYILKISQGKDRKIQNIVEELTSLSLLTNTLNDNVDAIKKTINPLKVKVDQIERLALPSREKNPAKPAIRKVTKVLRALETKSWKLESFSPEILEALKFPTFNHWLFQEADLMHLMRCMFHGFGLIEHFKIDENMFMHFLTIVRGTYNKNPFHNFQHCFCVTQMMYALLNVTGVHAKLGYVEKLALMMAAIGHDLDHPGFNNAYQVNACTELATTYNDISPLENHHSAVLFTILRSLEPKLLTNLSTQDYKDFRRVIITCILATDMAKHGEIMASAKAAAENFNIDDPNHRLLLFQLLIKCSDISNEVRPDYVADKWVDNLLEEFFTQSDKEKLEGLPTAPFMDREKVTKPSAQVGFIGFVMIPLFEVASKFLPNMEDHFIKPIRRALDHYKSMLEKK